VHPAEAGPGSNSPHKISEKVEAVGTIAKGFQERKGKTSKKARKNAFFTIWRAKMG
jgi:hypothetical protein